MTGTYLASGSRVSDGDIAATLWRRLRGNQIAAFAEFSTRLLPTKDLERRLRELLIAARAPFVRRRALLDGGRDE
jgi:hypothetical protein